MDTKNKPFLQLIDGCRIIRVYYDNLQKSFYSFIVTPTVIVPYFNSKSYEVLNWINGKLTDKNIININLYYPDNWNKNRINQVNKIVEQGNTEDKDIIRKMLLLLI